MKTTPIFFSAFFLTVCSGFAQTAIQDTDGNTQVQTEASANEDKIRMTTGGTERLVISRNPSNFSLFDFPNNGENIFLGELAGSSTNIFGAKNVFVGFNAGAMNASGNNNTFVGHKAGANNTSLRNSFFGTSSGVANTSGGSNSFFGENSGAANTTGGSNTFVGQNSGSSTTTGSENVYVGLSAGIGNTTGSGNAAFGRNAGGSGISHSNCTFLGRSANGSPNGLTNATALGNGAVVNASNKIRFGNTAVTVIEGQVAYTVSDGRFKRDVRADAPGLSFVMGLRPVTYQFAYTEFSNFLGEKSVDHEVLAEKELTREMGFVAQDVERLCLEQGLAVSNLVHAPESDADNYSVAYGQMVVPLVQAVQEQQAQIETQKAEIEALKILVNQLLATQTAAPALPAPALECWPNPAGSTLNVTLRGLAASATLSLFDANGTLLRTQPARDGAQTLDLAGLPAGAYFLQAGGSGQPAVSKIMVKAAE